MPFYGDMLRLFPVPDDDFADDDFDPDAGEIALQSSADRQASRAPERPPQATADSGSRARNRAGRGARAQEWSKPRHYRHRWHRYHYRPHHHRER